MDISDGAMAAQGRDGIGAEHRAPAPASARRDDRSPEERPAAAPDAPSAVPFTVVAGHGASVDGIDLGALAQAVGTLATDSAAPFGSAETGLDPRELSQVLATLEELRSALGALEIRTTTALDERLRAEDVAAGVPARDQGRRTAGEIRMASRVSPATASARLRSGQRLVRDMPRVFHALAEGTIGVEAAHAIGRSSGPIEPADRALVDEVIVERLPDLDGASPGRWSQEVSALAHQLDPHGADLRHLHARRKRHVTITPGAHGMGHLHALLPALDAAAIRRRLSLEAESLSARGDRRPHAAIMADLLADTLIGRDEDMDPVRLDVGVVITERSLLAPAHGDPATIEGYGVVPPIVVRDEIVARHPRQERPLGGGEAEGVGSAPRTAAVAEGETETDTASAPAPAEAATAADAEGAPAPAAGPASATGDADPQATPMTDIELDPETARRSAELDARLQQFAEESRTVLRRLYTHPTSGELVAVESRARIFPRALARLVRMRDATCAAPYCSAPIRQIDHIVPHARGGPTSADDGQGLCAHCNGTKELLGTAERVGDASQPHRVHWTSRLGRTADVSPAALTGIPGASAPPASALPSEPPRSADDPERMAGEERAPAPTPTDQPQRRRIRLLDPDQIPEATPSPDPYEGEDIPFDPQILEEMRCGAIPLDWFPTVLDLPDLEDLEDVPDPPEGADLPDPSDLPSCPELTDWPEPKDWPEKRTA